MIEQHDVSNVKVHISDNNEYSEVALVNAKCFITEKIVCFVGKCNFLETVKYENVKVNFRYTCNETICTHCVSDTFIADVCVSSDIVFIFFKEVEKENE